MFARLTTGQLTRDKLDEFLMVYRESIIPAAKLQNGINGDYCLTNRKTGKFVTITFWDKEENAIANEQSGYYQEQLNKIKPFQKGSLSREIYEVSAEYI